MISVLKEMKQDEVALSLDLDHLTISYYIFQGPLCGFSSSILKIFDVRE